ncbi:unnamed protein product [Heligmosomoides polygyrus]|uniref:RNase H domain-containing protein n=1 Tax=Heligmosomoides polygyrus TaxID=6339 RepID=A0A183FFG2_HELPZ|nr:unnamed protein product [Heligmosomoides polygyrus]
MELTQRAQAFSGQHNELEDEHDQPMQAKWARIDTHTSSWPSQERSSRETRKATTSSWGTGCEMSIIPVNVLRRARKLVIDLNGCVTRIPGVDAVVRNASGKVMSFLNTVATAGEMEVQDLITPIVGEELYQILEQPQSRKFACGMRKKMSSTRSLEEVSTQRQLQHGNYNHGNRNYARGQCSGRRNCGSRYMSYNNKRAFGLHNF